MFSIENLHAGIAEKPIIHGLSLTIQPGEIHVIMGPNGSGKSTLANCIMGHPQYAISAGSIVLDGQPITDLKADKRAQKGVFLAFQYPKEIPGVSVINFLKTAVASVRKARKKPELSAMEFRKMLRNKLKEFSLDATFMNRSMNDGFSGGEKKKMEILQMAFLEPKIAILDETDSGLDVDALKIVSEGIEKLTAPDRGILLITHYQRILHYIKPHFIHVMMHGRIVKSGGPELGEKLEREGYEWIRKEIADAEPVPVGR